MKSQFLKIAGVKTDEQFYKLFPSETSFFKKHPEAKKYIKTAQNGADLNSNGIPDEYEELRDIQNDMNPLNPVIQNSFNKRDLEGVDTSLGTFSENPQTSDTESGSLAKVGGANGLLKAGVGVVQGISMLKEGKRNQKEAEQFNSYSKVALLASMSRPKIAKRKYNRPEDNVFSGDSFFPINGVGTNVLARNGRALAQEGGEFDYANMGEMGSQLYNGITDNEMNGGSKIGGSVGSVAGSLIGGPIGGMIGQIGGNIIGGLLDSSGRKAKKAQEASQRNIDAIRMNTSLLNMQENNKAFLRNGGDLSELEESGELETLWGGEAEQISHNPHHGETIMFRGQSHDEADSQGNSGIGINYGNNPVEVERGEPAAVLKNSETGEDNLVIFGNLKIPKFAHDILQDPKAKNKKFKNYVADLSKEETRLNKYIETSKKNINNLEGNNSFDKVELESNNLKLKGSMMKLKDISDKKHQLSDLQNIINDTAEEHGFVADDLAKGKITRDKVKQKALQEAMNGYEVLKAQDGLNAQKKIRTNVGAQSARTYVQPGTEGLFGGMSEDNLKEFLKRNKELFQERGIDLEKVDFKSKKNPKWDGKNAEKKWLPSESLLNVQKIYNEEARKYNSSPNAGQAKADYLNEDGYYGQDTDSINAAWMAKREHEPDLTIDNQSLINASAPLAKQEANRPIVEYKRNKYMDAFNQVLPFIRPSNATPLDGNQLLGEMYGMTSNQLEAVQTQNYRPELRTPYDISLQDQLNEVTAGQRAAQRATMNSPEVQSDMAATAYNAKSRILAEQFRANQGMKEQIYSGNTATLNDAQLRNLGTNDQQYTRQEQAKSNTKSINQSILNSISSKYQQNKLENRTLGIQENMYNYRFDRSGRAINMNGLFQANVDQSNYNYDKDGVATHENIFNAQGKLIEQRPLRNSNVVNSSYEKLSIPSSATPSSNPNNQDIALSDLDIEEENKRIAKGLKNNKMKYGGYISNGSIIKSLK